MYLRPDLAPHSPQLPVAMLELVGPSKVLPLSTDPLGRAALTLKEGRVDQDHTSQLTLSMSILPCRSCKDLFPIDLGKERGGARHYYMYCTGIVSDLLG